VTNGQITRRRALQAGIGTGVVIVLAGCQRNSSSEGEPTTDDEPANEDGGGEQAVPMAPQANFATDYNHESGGSSWSNSQSASESDGSLTITHTGGDSIRASNLTIEGAVGGSVVWADADGYGPDSGITAGDSVDYPVATDDTVRVIWSSASTDRTDQLKKWTGPDA